jgi:hypothetical protein
MLRRLSTVITAISMRTADFEINIYHLQLQKDQSRATEITMTLLESVPR